MKQEITKKRYLEPEIQIGWRREKERMHKTHESRKKCADLRNIPAGASGMGRKCEEQNQQQQCMMKRLIFHFNSKLANAQTEIQ